MTKPRIIQIIAIVILVIGIIHFVDYFAGQTDGALPYAGIGNLIMGVALIVVSRNKMIDED